MFTCISKKNYFRRCHIIKIHSGSCYGVCLPNLPDMNFYKERKYSKNYRLFQ